MFDPYIKQSKKIVYAKFAFLCKKAIKRAAFALHGNGRRRQKKRNL
jgi:hypothetical protein